MQMDDFPIAFGVHKHDPPGLEICINFGVMAGRGASPAEIDRLAEWLLDEIGSVSIISEDRHEIDAHGEAAVHQVRIEVPTERVPAEFEERRVLEERLVERAEHWTRLCVADRHLDNADV
jgi:hypothetical protein